MPHVDTLPSPLHSVHIQGIAGTAMAALAGMLVDAGYEVTGSDRAIYPPMSTYLERLGIEVMQGFEASNLDHRPDLVVVGNVMRATYAESEALTASELSYMSFPELLGHLFLSDSHNVVVAGTHGKTTTTAVTAWLLDAAGLEPGFLVGGVALDFDRTARPGAGTHFVIEGDEYDTAWFDKGPKFLHYRPKTAILTSVEFDHADIYRDLDHVKQSFRKLMRVLPADGCLIVRGDDPGAADVAREATCEVWRYGPGQAWDGEVVDVDTATGTMRFRLLRDGAALGTFRTALVGEHNLYNQVAAAAAAIRAGVEPAALEAGFGSFHGIKRRQEVIGEPGGVTVIDDFAHHPTAVELTIAALRQRFGQRRLWVAWEPRSATSRRNVFQQAYARAFDGADRVLIAEPFDTSGIAEAERFDARRLVRDLAERGVDAELQPDGQTIARTLAVAAHPGDVIALFSNGAFGGAHARLLQLLEARFAG